MNYDILAGLYKEQGKYKASEQLYKKALAIEEKIFFHLSEAIYYTVPLLLCIFPVPYTNRLNYCILLQFQFIYAAEDGKRGRRIL